MPYSNRTMQSINPTFVTQAIGGTSKPSTRGLGTASSSARTQHASNNGTSGTQTPGLNKK